MMKFLIVFIIFFITITCDGFGQQQPLTRHETFQYKYSFKPPYLAQKDGSVPFWQYHGITIASEEMVKLTPSLKSKKGSIWTKQPTNFDYWEVEIHFRVTGRSRIGADGLAFFYTTIPLPEGPVYGSQDRWNGLAVMFDSFDNDQKSNNPYIMAMVNDGTKEYHHDLDGTDQQLAGCMRDFRNKPYPVRAKIEYYNHKLSLLFHNGNTNNDEDFELCFEAHEVYLPKYGYFGLSAATGSLSDDHDVLKVLTHSLLEPGQYNAPEAIADRDKYNKEFEAYKQKMDHQQQEYLKLHPEEAKKLKQNDPEAEYDTLSEREFQQILSAQGEIHDILRNLNHKLDEILGKQERSLSMMSALQTGSYQQHPNQQQAQYQQPAATQSFPLVRHEFESLMAQQNELIGNSRQIKQTIISMANTAQHQPASIQQASQFNQQILTETKEGVDTLRRELANIGTRMMAQAQPVQSTCPNCLTTTTFLFAIAVQIALMIVYQIYSNRGDSSKKFY